MTAMTTTARYTVEPYTYSWATEPDYWYVWDNGTSGSVADTRMVGGKFATREAAQADADERNSAAAAPATCPTIVGGELSDKQYDLADRIELVLEAAPATGLTPSAIARKVKATTVEVATVLAYLVGHRYAHTSGNRAWTHYRAGRA